MSDPQPEGRRSRSRGGGFAQSMAFSAVRGGGLIALAIVIGLVLLQVIDTSGGDGSNGGVTVTTDPTETTADTQPSETTQPGDGTEPTDETRPPGEIRVLVLNGADPDAALAGPLTEVLRTAGYQTVAPNNTAARDGTVVACKEDFTADAPALAVAVGETAVVEPFPEPPPENAENVGSYDCLVVLGA